MFPRPFTGLGGVEGTGTATAIAAAALGGTPDFAGVHDVHLQRLPQLAAVRGRKAWRTIRLKAELTCPSVGRPQEQAFVEAAGPITL